MENEIMEEIIQENPSAPMENPSDPTDVPSDVLPDTEIVETLPDTSPDVYPDEDIQDSTVLDPVPDASTGEEFVENDGENIYEMENGNENFYDSVSGNDIGSDSYMESDGTNTYVTYNYTMETEEVIPLWENHIGNFSTSEMLLFMIFLLLLVQFVHNIFKGSHWLKG